MTLANPYPTLPTFGYFCILTCSVFTTTLWSRYACYSHGTDKETEALVLGHLSRGWPGNLVHGSSHHTFSSTSSLRFPSCVGELLYNAGPPSTAVVLTFGMLPTLSYSSSCCGVPWTIKLFHRYFITVILLLLWVIMQIPVFPMVLGDGCETVVSCPPRGCPTDWEPMTYNTILASEYIQGF